MTADPEYPNPLEAPVTDDLKPDDELDPDAADGEPEPPDVATDPVEDDPSADHNAPEEE